MRYGEENDCKETRKNKRKTNIQIEMKNFFPYNLSERHFFREFLSFVSIALGFIFSLHPSLMARK